MKRLFWPVITLTICVALFELHDQTILQNTAAPYGIVSLEIGHNLATDTSIINSWKDSIPGSAPQDFCSPGQNPVIPLNTARSDVWLDYPFIVLYTTALILILGRLPGGRQGSVQGAAPGRDQWGAPSGALLTALAVAAGLCDGIENVGLLQFINGGGSDWIATRTSGAAIAKMAILALLTLHILYQLVFRHEGLTWLTNYILVKARQLFRYRVILLGVIFFATPIWALDQGQDLLINSNSGDIGIVLFIGVVMIAAALNWWLAKLFFQPGFRGQVLPRHTPMTTLAPAALESEKKVSRYLGICTIVAPAAAILNALRAIRMPYWLDQFGPFTWLAGLLILFFVLVKYDVAQKGYSFLQTRWGSKTTRFFAFGLFLVLAILLPLGLRLFVMADSHRSPFSLNFLFLHLMLLAFTFYLFVSVRKCLFPDESPRGGLPGFLVMTAGAVLATGFILYNLIPFAISNMDGCYLSLPVLLSGVVFYTLSITGLLRLGLARKINFLLFIFVIGLLLAIKGNNHYHDVRLITVKTAPEKVCLGDYFKAWLLYRQQEIDSSPGPYPVFLVNTYGGGIRAAAFTTMVLSWLDSAQIQQGRSKKGFEHYVFSLSGASGGTVGAAVQCAFRAMHGDSDTAVYAHYRDDLLNFYQHDFLTPVLSNMLGRDIWASTIGLSLWKDRSVIQEELWARYGRDLLHLDLDTDYNAFWDTSAINPVRYEVPLLFSNTLNVDNGLKGICAPVDLDHEDFGATIFVREKLDSINAHPGMEKHGFRSIPLITGAFLSARFPYISPSGKMGPGFHFIDGGLKDNSGASTSEDIFLALSRWAECSADTTGNTTVARLLNHVRFYFVSISNSVQPGMPDPEPDPRLLVSNRWELISPFVGIINSGTDGNARRADSILRFRYTGHPPAGVAFAPGYCAVWPTAFCITDADNQPYSPVLPLGWQISVPALNRLSNSFTPENIRSNPVGIEKILGILPK